jgi:hypothetical protein
MTKKSKTRPGRGSDQFIIRMPAGMRDHLAKLAEEHGRSMNAEALEALERWIAKDLPGTGTSISQEGLDAISKRLEATTEELERLYFDVRDIDLEPYMSDQRSQGFDLTRHEAIRKILRTYLDERGYGGGRHPQISDLIDRLTKDNRKGGK